jgi:hypothetical protein
MGEVYSVAVNTGAFELSTEIFVSSFLQEANIATSNDKKITCFIAFFILIIFIMN